MNGICLLRKTLRNAIRSGIVQSAFVVSFINRSIHRNRGDCIGYEKFIASPATPQLLGNRTVRRHYRGRTRRYLHPIPWWGQVVGKSFRCRACHRARRGAACAYSKTKNTRHKKGGVNTARRKASRKPPSIARGFVILRKDILTFLRM